MTTTVRTLLAVLALVTGMLFVTGTPATAAAPPHSGSCHSLSEGYKSWLSFQTTLVDCSVAHEVGKKWSGCGRSSSTVTPMHCAVEVSLGSFVRTFNCANTKGAQQPAHYIVHCHHGTSSKVSFEFWPYGFRPAARARAATPWSDQCDAIVGPGWTAYGWRLEHLACGHAHSVARRWASSCQRIVAAGTWSAACHVTETIDGQSLTFSCVNLRLTPGSSRWLVSCHHGVHEVEFHQHWR